MLFFLYNVRKKTKIKNFVWDTNMASLATQKTAILAGLHRANQSTGTDSWF